jgi:hypothetical protein
MFNEVDASGSRVTVMKRKCTLMYLSFRERNWSAPAVSRISSFGVVNEQGGRMMFWRKETHGIRYAVDLARAFVDFYRKKKS